MSYLGTNKIGKLFFGSVEIAKAYLGTDVVFQSGPPAPPSPGSDGKIWAYYVTTANNQSVTLVSSSATGLPSTMVVDDVEVTFASSYTFAEAGEHIVKFPIGATVPTYMFYNLSSYIKEVYWPEGPTTLGGNTFRGNTSIKKALISSTVTTIATRAFYNTEQIQIIVSKATTPPTVANSTTLYGLNSLQAIYVPYSANHSILNAYKAKQYWSNYAAKMVELNRNGTIPE